MKTIGVLIGTSDEPVTKKYYNSNKHKLKFLKEYDIYSNYIPYDYAIFAEIKYLGEKNNFNVIPLFGQKLTLKDCNKCDFIFCIFEGVYAFINGKMEMYKNNMSVLRRTKAKVFPSQEMQEFIIKKHKYMTYLKKKGFKIPLTKFIDLKKVNIDNLTKFIQNNNLDKFIIKPELGAFKTGFKMLNNPNKVKGYLEQLKKQDYNRLLVQPFIGEFNKYGEIKTYWINGENVFSYKQQWKNGEGIFDKQQNIEPELLKECIETGKKLLKVLFKDQEKLIQCRIDFACCLENDKRCRDFFINEIEICPTGGSSYYELYGSYYSKIAETVLKFCK